MLKAFKDHMRTLSIDPKDQFHFFVRKRVGKKATLILEKKLKKLILLTPGVIGRIYELWEHYKTPLEAKKMSGYLLTYMYHPKDFLPEESLGLFGYLDDAYFVATVFEMLADELKSQGHVINRGDEKTLETLRSLRKSARIVIRSEAEKIDKMIQEILRGEKEVFTAMFA